MMAQMVVIRLHREPPDAERHVRWCGGAVERPPYPIGLLLKGRSLVEHVFLVFYCRAFFFAPAAAVTSAGARF